MTELQLKCFVCVESYRSFTKAADELHVVQATVSRQISALEEEIGVKLFERDSHGVRPTISGEMFAKYAPVFLEYQKTIISRVRNAFFEVEHTLRLGVGPYESYLLREPLKALYKQYPKTVAEVTMYTYFVLLTRYRNNVLDLALCNAQAAAQMSDFHAVEIYNQNWIVAAAAEHPIWQCDPTSPELFDGRRIITLVDDQYNVLRGYCDRHFPNCRLVETNFLPALFEQVSSGMGIAILPPFVTQHLPQGVIAKDILKVPFAQHFYLMINPRLLSEEKKYDDTTFLIEQIKRL